MVDISVVFVHGLQGHRIGTWSKPRTEPTSDDKKLGLLDRVRHRVSFAKKPEIQGDVPTTAENEEEGPILWPRDLLPQKINNIRVLTYGYESKVTGYAAQVNTNGIYRHAENLLSALERERSIVSSFLHYYNNLMF